MTVENEKGPEPKVQPIIAPSLRIDDPEWIYFKRIILAYEGGTNFEYELLRLAMPGVPIVALKRSNKLLQEVCKHYNEIADGAILFDIQDRYGIFGTAGAKAKHTQGVGEKPGERLVAEEHLKNGADGEKDGEKDNGGSAQGANRKDEFETGSLLVLFSNKMAGACVILFRESYLTLEVGTWEPSDTTLAPEELDKKVVAVVRCTASREFPTVHLLIGLLHRSAKLHGKPIYFRIWTAQHGNFEKNVPLKDASADEVRGWLVSWFVERGISTSSFPNRFDMIYWDGKDLRQLSKGAMLDLLRAAGLKHLANPLVESIQQALVR